MFSVSNRDSTIEFELPWDPGISPSYRQRWRSSKGHRPEPGPGAGFVVYSAAAAHPKIFDFFFHVSCFFLNWLSCISFVLKSSLHFCAFGFKIILHFSSSFSHKSFLHLIFQIFSRSLHLLPEIVHSACNVFHGPKKICKYFHNFGTSSFSGPSCWESATVLAFPSNLPCKISQLSLFFQGVHAAILSRVPIS